MYYYSIYYGLSSVFIAEDGWCAKDVKDVFLQVDFLLKTRVTRVGVLRRKSKDHWIEKYSLQYSDDDITWTDYMENGYTKVGNIQSRDISIRHFQKGCTKFLLPFCTLSTGNLMEGVRWSIKAGTISENRNKQTSDHEHEKNCIVPERKEIRAVCVLTPRLFSHSTLSSRLRR